GELRRAEDDAVAVDEPTAPLLLTVDEDLGLPVPLFEVEVAAIEDDLRVMVDHVGGRDKEVVVDRPTYRRHRLLEAGHTRSALARKVFERRHSIPLDPSPAVVICLLGTPNRSRRAATNGQKSRPET